MGLTLGVTLTALVMERVLRLIDLVSNSSGELNMVFSLAFFLIPHYVGLALPAAFFIALFTLIARLDNESELAAFGSAGISLMQIARPLVLAGALLACVSMLLFGFLQPYSRYLYREIRHIVSYTGWNLEVTPGVFFSPDENITVHAGVTDGTGRKLRDVVIVERGRVAAAGDETVTLADRGVFVADDSRSRLRLVLEDGTQTLFRSDGRVRSLAFEQMSVQRDFSFTAPPFRARGEDERELTVLELDSVARDETFPPEVRAASRSEVHARIVRALSLPVLPLLAIAVAVAARRSGRATGMVFGGVLLVAFHHTLQLGETMADRNTLPPAIALWGPFAVFAGFSFWAFHRTNASPGEPPIANFIARTERAYRAVFAALRRVGSRS